MSLRFQSLISVGCGTARALGAIAGAALLSVTVAGCGVGAPSTADPSAADESSTGDEAAPGGGGNPGVVVTPAAGGGVVVGDPTDAGRPGLGASRGDEEMPADRAGRVVEDKGGDQPAVAAATPAPAPTDGPNRMANIGGSGRAERYEEDDPASVPAPAEAPPRGPGRPGLEPGDEDFSPRVGALAEDKGGFANPPTGSGNREQAEATAGRIPPGTGRIEDVDAPPAGSQPSPRGGPNAAMEARGGRFEDGDERFVGGGGGIGIQPAESIQIKRGSAEDVGLTFLSLVAAGDLERAKPLIAGRATGLLAKLRDGTATPEQIDELKASAAIAQQENSRAKGGTHRLITYRADKKMLLLEAENKEEDSCVVKLDVRNAPRRRNN